MERKIVYVLDTSVIIKWFVEEVDSDKAIEILENYRLGNITIVAPDLLIYEFANILRFNKKFDRHEKRECLKSLYDLDLYFVTPYHSLVENTEKIAEEYDITVYDAVFVALAKEMKCEFITADEKFYRKISHFPFVKLLSEMG